MIEVSLASLAWVSVVVLQYWIHFVALPRQRKHIEDDAKLEAEIRKNIAQNGVCDAKTYQRCCYSSDNEDVAVLGNVSSVDDDADEMDDSIAEQADMCRRRHPLHVEPGDDEDLDAIDDGEEEERLKLLKYYYSPSSPDIYSMEPFRSSCGSISSLDVDPDPRVVEQRRQRQKQREHDIVQPTLHSIPPPSPKSVTHGVLKRRGIDNDTHMNKKHVGFTCMTTAQSSPILTS